MPRDPELLAHQQWLGFLQPVGLVVSPPALLQAQAHVNVNIVAEHHRFLGHVADVLAVGRREPLPAIKNLRALLVDVFGWQATDLVEASDPRTAALEVVLPEYHETLRPTFAVPDDSRVPHCTTCCAASRRRTTCVAASCSARCWSAIPTRSTRGC